MAGTIFVDEDGNEYSEDQVDWSQFEVDKPVESFGERTADKTFATFADKFGDIVGGGERYIHDLLTNPNINIFEGETAGIMPKTSPADIIRGVGLPEGLGLSAERGKDRQDYWRDVASQVRDSGQFEDSPYGKVKDLGSSAVANVAGMGSMFVNPWLFLADQGLSTTGKEYGELSDKGVDQQDALLAAGERGAFDAVSNEFLAPLKFLKGGGYLSSIPKTIGSLTGINALNETNRQITDQTILGDGEVSGQDLLSTGYEVGADAIKRLPETVAQSVIMGPLGRARTGKSGDTTTTVDDILAKGPMGEVSDINVVDQAVLPKTEETPLPATDIEILSKVEDVLNPEKPLTSSRLRSAMDILNQDPSKSDQATSIIAPDVYKSVREKFSADSFLPEESRINTQIADIDDPSLPRQVMEEIPLRKDEFTTPEIRKPKIEEPTTGEKTFPDPIQKKVKDAASSEIVTPAEQISESGKPSIGSGEAGAINIKPIIDFSSKVKEKFVDITRSYDDIEARIKKIDEQYGGKSRFSKPDELERSLSGELFGREIPGASALKQVWETGMVRPKQLAQEATKIGVPQFQRAYDLTKDMVSFESLKANEYIDKLKPLYNLVDSTKFNEAVQKIQIQSGEAFKKGQKLTVTDDSLRKDGLSEADIQAYRATEKSMSEIYDFMRDTSLEESVRRWEKENPGRDNVDKLNAEQAKIKEFFASKKIQNYMPIHRYGDYAVWGEKVGPDGKIESFYNLFDSKSEQLKALENLAQRGFENRHAYKVPEATEPAHQNMPKELRLELDSLTGKAPSGFKAHMIQRKFVPGHEMDAQRNVAEYVSSAIQWASQRKFGQKILDEVNGIDPVKHPKLSKEAQDWYQYVNGPVKWEGQGIRKFLGHYHLGMLNPAAPVLNYTQRWTVTYPELRRLTDKPMKALKEADSLKSEYFKKPEALAKKNPQLFEAIQKAEKEGILDDSSMRELYGMGKKGGARSTWNTMEEFGMSLNAKVERGNRVSAYIAGYLNAPKGADADYTARKFVDDTQFDYSRYARPKVARGKMAPLYTFKMFGHNYFGNLRNATKELFSEYHNAKVEADPAKKAEYTKNYKTALGVLGRYTGAMTALGGAKATPFYVVADMAIKALTGQGVDERLEEGIGKGPADLFKYGVVGNLLGASFNAALSPSELSLVEDQSTPGEKLWKVATGAVGDLPNKALRAKKAYDLSGSMMRGAEEIAPRTIKNLMAAKRWADDGAAKNLLGETIMENPSPYEIALKALSFNPNRYAELQRREQDVREIQGEVNSESEGLLRKIAIARQIGDYQSEQELYDYAESKGIDVSEGRVRDIIKKNEDPEARLIGKTPKRGRDRVQAVIDKYK